MSMTTWYVIAGGLALNAAIFGWLTGCMVLTQYRQRKARRALNAATLAHIETQRQIDQALDLASDTPVHDRLMVEWFARELDDEAVVAAWIEESA